MQNVTAYQTDDDDDEDDRNDDCVEHVGKDGGGNHRAKQFV
jgi:hypothetical protein